jgi:hypothetical protein
MYFYTIVGAGGFGLGILFIPEVIQSAFGFPALDPVVLGIVGSVYAAFGLLSIPDLRSPMNFVPILLLQLCYKVIWVGIIAAPLLFSSGRFPFHAAVLLVIFATYIIGDIIAIPFSSILSKGIITASRRDLRC